ncbi:hypothetical protein T492DRAFT_1063291 [Pavlovales sp. CCMP2436]|nr:hypothetical protein T492DRAFT_1063291 [Pavlovales sp. CCMP2436]
MAAAVRWLRLRNVPLLRQLRLEEALFRAPSGAWVVTNIFGSAGYDDEGAGDTADGPERHVQAIAMGISGKPELLLNEPLVRSRRVPVIRRFTGGGTVVLDRGSLMVSLIADHSIQLLYSPPLPPQKTPDLQYILVYPGERPKYRGERAHRDFLVGLSSALPSRRYFWEGLARKLGPAFGTAVEMSPVYAAGNAADEAALGCVEEGARASSTEPTRVRTRLVDWPL